MNNAPAKEVSASALVEPPAIPIPPKVVPPWPDGVPIKLKWAGQSTVQHPVTKQFIGVKKAIELGGKVEVQVNPTPQATAPENPPATVPATAPANPPTTAPTAEPEQTPDFSELGEPAAGGGDASGSYDTTGEVYHGAIEGLAVGVFGPEMLTDDTEKGEFRTRWAAALAHWQAAILTPPELLGMTYIRYVMRRAGVVWKKVVGWYVVWRAKKTIKGFNPKVVPKTPEPQASANQQAQGQGASENDGPDLED